MKSKYYLDLTWGPVVRNQPSTAGVHVQSLVWELRPPHAAPQGPQSEPTHPTKILCAAAKSRHSQINK